MLADRYLHRASDGSLVDETDPRARSLAYSPGDELSPEDAANLAEKKAAKPAANKARLPRENKGRS